MDPSASALLRLLDQQPDSSAERGRVVLGALSPGADAAEHVGARHAELLRVRAALAGDRIDAVGTCRCGQQLDLSLSTTDLLRHAGTGAAGGTGAVTIEHQGHVVTARLPRDADLAAVAATTTDPAEARTALLTRVVTRARAGGHEVDPDSLPDDVVARLADALDEADPLAAPVLALSCPECGAATTAELDVATFVHAELRRRADDVLLEVDTLARRYGWTEDVVLALAPARRRRYLELAP